MIMIRKECSIEIARPVHEVFAFVDDPAKAQEWLGLCVSLSQVTPGPKQVGTRMHYVYRQGGKTGEMDGEVTAYVADQLLGMKFQDKLFEAGLEYGFVASPTGTVMKQSWEVEPKGFTARLMAPMIAAAAEKQIRQDMERLKTLLEGRRPTGSI